MMDCLNTPIVCLPGTVNGKTLTSFKQQTDAVVISYTNYTTLLKMYTTLIFLLAKLLLVGWMCVVPLQGQRPGQVDPLTLNQADPQCWESSSGRLLEMRSPRIADTVPAFWNLMVFLKASDNRKHSALFWDLAQVFWDTYVDCILSRTHGLGRRQSPWPREKITAMHSLITDKSFVKDSKTNSSKLKESSQSLLSVQVQRTGSGILRHVITHAKDKEKKRSQT